MKTKFINDVPFEYKDTKFIVSLYIKADIDVDLSDNKEYEISFYTERYCKIKSVTSNKSPLCEIQTRLPEIEDEIKRIIDSYFDWNLKRFRKW